MRDYTDSYQVVIVGGGPIGLFLGLYLQRLNISCLVLEEKQQPDAHSRSIGIHPVSLEYFHKLGIAEEFVQRGTKIQRGIARSGSRQLGTLSFNGCPKPFNYILSLPQYETEQLLQNNLNRASPDILLRGARFLSIDERKSHVLVNFELEGRTRTVKCDFLVGCDGINSKVRTLARILFKGRSYPDTFVMGDFADNTDYGTDAVIFLCRKGLVESFPLVGNRRRWVVKTDQYLIDPARCDVERLLLDRTGVDLSGESCFMLSSFGVQKLMASTFFKGRIILAGDAAHVVSPIGGQGMNLGWMGAWKLASALGRYYSGPGSDPFVLLRDYSQHQRRTARKVVRRAEFNMRLGRKTRLPALRNALVRFLLNTPLSGFMARIFTMRMLNH